jgi:NADPH-dependent glutamate synthase beta subunit-like oxidoreductase/formate hydrogenlyase subunit 6/NADH:ubiquinone oxidoreductase subunit I/NADH:ubiquinone oxidoreductase subunit F (NADH-binding)
MSGSIDSALPLPAWLAASDDLSGDLAAPVLLGLARAQGMNPLQRLAVLRDAGLVECGAAGEPLYPIWRQFLRGHGPSELVIDAAGPDPRERAAAAILERAPVLLAEALLIAAGLRESQGATLILPPELAGLEVGLLNAMDSIRSRGLAQGRRLPVKVSRGGTPRIWGEGHATEGDRLIHTPETWCRIALAFSASEATLTDISGRMLFTLRRGLRTRGLVELERRDHLRRLIYEWGGGVEVEGQDAILAFDNGMGGFLPLSDADLRCQPEDLAAVGIAPSPSTVLVLPEGSCVVEQTRRAMHRYWELSESAPAAVRALLGRVARLVTELCVGQGRPAHVEELDALALELATQGLAAAWPLGSALRHYRQQWLDHANRSRCPDGGCALSGPIRRAAPCQSKCPANIDIPSFMAHIGHGEYRASLAVILRDNPLPLTCGLVCPAPCESACVRGGKDGAVFIRPMKAVAAEHCLADGGYPRPEIAPATGKRIGIVGSGPAGLSAAYYLRLLGHDVEIHESQEEAGGMLRYGIPAYRLPPALLDRELAQIKALGVPIRTGEKVAKLEEFRAQGFDAVFLALGTQMSRFIPIEGVHHSCVLGGIDFLRTVRGGEDLRVGPRVVVIGGGNVAIDVALTALRQGAKRVDMVCLEKRREMPASPHEIETAVAEGVILHPGWGPVSIGEEGEVVFQHCDRVFDAEHRFNPQFDSERRLTLEGDQVMLAVGQGTDLSSIDGSGLNVTRGFIVTDPRTLMTSVAGVFAGGDVAHGPRTAVEAIRSGKIAAASIDAWLAGRAPDPATGKPVRRAEVTPLRVVAKERTTLHRAEMPELEVADRVAGYHKIEQGLTDAMAQGEASRCLRCDICIGCGLCQLACSEMGVEALRMAETPAGRLAYFDFTRPAERCIGCGACAQVCPTGAIRIEDGNGTRRTVITGTVVREQPLLKCGQCGAPTQTAAQRAFVRERLPSHMAAHLDRELCPACARLLADRPRSLPVREPA